MHIILENDSIRFCTFISEYNYPSHPSKPKFTKQCQLKKIYNSLREHLIIDSSVGNWYSSLQRKKFWEKRKRYDAKQGDKLTSKKNKYNTMTRRLWNHVISFLTIVFLTLLFILCFILFFLISLLYFFVHWSFVDN